MDYRFQLLTFGCKVNQYEGELLRQNLARLHWLPASPTTTINASNVNTCAGTDRAHRTARQAVRSLHRRHPDVPIFVTGCGARSRPEAFRKLPGVLDVLPAKDDLLRRLADLHAPSPETIALAHTLTDHTTRTRALLKIQDGCDAFCSYCIVPHVRPNPSSKPPDLALDEAQRLLHAGHREIVLTGIHVGLYGRDLDIPDALPKLCRQLASLKGLLRLRLSSIELLEVSDPLLELLADGTLCPHLHVPLQSGDDRVLSLMNRRYTADRFLQRVQELRSALPSLALTTDCLVGFPGESDSAFQNTLDLCRAVRFSKIHVFPFSPRQGTPAAAMPDRPDPDDLRLRRDRLLELSDCLGLDFRRQFLNRTVEVLVENTFRGADKPAEGLTPDFLRVLLPDASLKRGDLVAARIAAAQAQFIYAESAELLSSPAPRPQKP